MAFIIENEILIGYTEEEDVSEAVIPEGVVSIGDWAFEECSGLKRIILPESIRHIGDGAFLRCYGLEQITLPEGITEIGMNTFAECWSLCSVELPQSLRTIGFQAFRNCIQLTRIVLPARMDRIMPCAFRKCESLTSIRIPEGIMKIEADTFLDCAKLVSVTIPDGVTEIETGAFMGCWMLKNVRFPESVDTIGKDAFSFTAWIKQKPGKPVIVNHSLIRYQGEEMVYAVPDHIRKISTNAFSGCKTLEEVILPKELTQIEKETFADCINLRRVVIPEGVTSIGDSAFSGCPHLADVNIPQSAERIGMNAFAGTEWLECYPEEMVIFNGILIQYNGKAPSVVIPEGVRTIGAGAFAENSSLQEIIIPEGVLRICDHAFVRCQNLTSVHFPASARWTDSIGLDWCASLRSIIFQGVRIDLTRIEYGLLFGQWGRFFNMLDTKEFETEFRSEFVPAAMLCITGFFLHTDDPDAEAYVRAQIDRIMPLLIRHDNPVAIQKLLDIGTFVTAENIDSFIDCAAEYGTTQSRIMLLHYKSEVLGYADPADTFNL